MNDTAVNVSILLLNLLFFHFIGDFIMQSHEMSMKKSKSFKWLCFHCIVYGVCFVPFFGYVFSGWTAFLHMCIDFISSKVTSRLYLDGKIHWFFCVIGFDQFLHAFCLIFTALLCSDSSSYLAWTLQ